MMMDMLQKFRERKWEWIALFVIIIIGIFLRTYNFHTWLHFGSDQARDAVLVEDVVYHSAPWPLLGADASNTHFKLGPVYHYFQIISAEIFGSDVAVLAYPDLFLSILAIALFYFLLKRYFEKNLSLALIGLYAISFYVIEYARFAWNPNPIPFFVMLYLYAMLEFLEHREKTHSVWIVLLGISLGVGIQLHTLLLLLLPTISFFVFLFLIKKNWRTFGKIAVVIVIAFLCNFGQIQSEWETGGANTERFFIASTDRSQSGMNRLWQNVQADILAHAEANTHILSSLGDRGNFAFLKILKHPEKIKDSLAYNLYRTGIVVSVLFSLFGYGLLGVCVWQESDPKRKHFLVLIFLYVTCSFFILLSIARDAPLRYFIHTTFVPFILLGLWIDWLKGKLTHKFFLPVVVFLFMLLFITNAHTLISEARELETGMKGDSGFVVLGEAERMVEYIVEQSFPERKATLLGGTQYVSTYYKSLKYLADQRGFQLNRLERKMVPIAEQPYFFITHSQKGSEVFEVDYFTSVGHQDFGRVGLYQLKKQ